MSVVAMELNAIRWLAAAAPRKTDNSLMPYRFTFALWLGAMLTAVAATCVAGCGRSDESSLRGKVLHKDGSPVVAARVLLRHAESGNSLSQNTESDGSFKFRDGVEPGNYAVGIVEDRGDVERPSPPTIAAKYRDPSSSGLSVEIKNGESEELNLTVDSP